MIRADACHVTDQLLTKLTTDHREWQRWLQSATVVWMHVHQYWWMHVHQYW